MLFYFIILTLLSLILALLVLYLLQNSPANVGMPFQKRYSEAKAWVSEQRKRLLTYFFATALGRALDRLVRHHLVSFAMLLLLSALALGFLQNKLTVVQVLVFTLMQQVVLHSFKATLGELRELAQSPETEARKLYYNCLLFGYVNLSLLLYFFAGDFYNLFLWLNTLSHSR